MGCAVGPRCGSDHVLLWLWSRPVAVTLIPHLAWEHYYATGVAQNRKRQKNYKNQVLELLLRHSGLSSVSAMPARRFSLRPGT